MSKDHRRRGSIYQSAPSGAHRALFGLVAVLVPALTSQVAVAEPLAPMPLESVAMAPAGAPGPGTPQRYSTGMWASGIVFMSLGGAGLATSGFLGILYSTSFDNHSGDDLAQAALATLIGGGLTFAIGVPLVLVGGSPETTDSAATKSSVALIAGPTGAALRVQF